MNNVVIIVLVIALALSNGGWLIYLTRRDERDRRERWDFLERIRTHDAGKPAGTPPPALTQYEKDQIKSMEKALQKANDKPVDEFDVVGAVNPNLPLREKSK
jgi:hypothetical protein